MPVSDVLKSFRKGEYGKKEGGDEKLSGPRSFKLTDEEAKEIGQGYSGGEEQQCLVTGRLGPDKEFTVSSVHLPGGEGEGDGGMPPMPPMMRSQTMPSPS